MDLYKLTVHELNDLLRKKEVSSVEITKSVLERIKNIDDKVNSYVTVTEDKALEDAKEADKKISESDNINDLTGIPISIKDNICTEGVTTTCSSKMLHNFVPPYNATVVNKLKEQGAFTIGKLNMDEFAMGSSNENSYFKITKNPYDLTRVPGGSSGGAAASIAADEAICALGSDTGGSIRQPASFCGIVGLKPTYGAVSRFGLIAFASSLDQIGPITKDVTDCAIMMNAIAGYDKMDSTSANIKHPDYKKSLIDDVKGLKIGVPKEYMGEGIDIETRKAIEKSLHIFKDMGAEFEEFSLPLSEYALPAYYIISSAEASSNLARYDGIKYGYRAKKFSDLLDLYKQTRSEGFGTEVKRRIMLGTYALSSGYYDAYYKKALQVRTLVMKDFDKAFEKYDIIISPTSPVTAFKIGERRDDPLKMYIADICTISVNIAGLPGLVVPCGMDSKGLPIGLQMIGKAYDETTLIKAGYSFERNTDYIDIKPKI